MGRMKQVYGIDIVAQPQKFGNATVIKGDLTKKIALPDSTATAVTMLAVLEHLPHPEKVVAEAYRMLKPGGVFLVTVPTPMSEPILEVMAKIGLVRDEMIEQHETYFTPELLKKICRHAGFRKAEVEIWELGVNTFLMATK
jgi:ubiquinone/menaquinone biosynthesis C-methylase UbiE